MWFGSCVWHVELLEQHGECRFGQHCAIEREKDHVVVAPTPQTTFFILINFFAVDGFERMRRCQRMLTLPCCRIPCCQGLSPRGCHGKTVGGLRQCNVHTCLSKSNESSDLVTAIFFDEEAQLLVCECGNSAGIRHMHLFYFSASGPSRHS